MAQATDMREELLRNNEADVELREMIIVARGEAAQRDLCPYLSRHQKNLAYEVP